MVVAQGSGADALQAALEQLPAGNYSIQITPDSGGVYMVDVTTAPEVEGVGLIPMLIIGIIAAIVGIFGLYFTWQVLKETSDILNSIPSYAWLIGGAALIFVLYKPVTNLLSSKT